MENNYKFKTKEFFKCYNQEINACCFDEAKEIAIKRILFKIEHELRNGKLTGYQTDEF